MQRQLIGLEKFQSKYSLNFGFMSFSDFVIFKDTSYNCKKLCKLRALDGAFNQYN